MFNYMWCDHLGGACGMAYLLLIFYARLCLPHDVCAHIFKFKYIFLYFCIFSAVLCVCCCCHMHLQILTFYYFPSAYNFAVAVASWLLQARFLAFYIASLGSFCILPLPVCKCHLRTYFERFFVKLLCRGNCRLQTYVVIWICTHICWKKIAPLPFKDIYFFRLVSDSVLLTQFYFEKLLFMDVLFKNFNFILCDYRQKIVMRTCSKVCHNYNNYNSKQNLSTCTSTRYFDKLLHLLMSIFFQLSIIEFVLIEELFLMKSQRFSFIWPIISIFIFQWCINWLTNSLNIQGKFT